MAKTYLNAGGEQAGLNAVKNVWDVYLYDLYDPNSKSNISDYPKYTYGDSDLEWPKDNTSSFHGSKSARIEQLSYDFLEGGVDYTNIIKDLDKKVTADAAGDKNTERKYKVDITADVQAQALGPVAMVLQIQTSWQLFDMLHANALIGQGSTEKGAAADNTAMANLYDIKHALLRFVDYMQANYPGSNLVLGVTEVQHVGSQTMLLDKDAGGKALYVTNNYAMLHDAIINWDSFGNCEHVHYDTKQLEAAVSALPDNLRNWQDMYGYVLSYDDIEKVAVIIGGSTENSNGDNGYGCTLPWKTFQTSKLNGVYGIRVNEGTPNGSALISWLDNTGNNTGSSFLDGSGTTFTEKYVTTNEEAVFQTLLQIARKEMKRKAIDITAWDKYVDNMTLTDTVTDEFALDPEEPVKAIVYNKDGSVKTETVVGPDDPNLQIDENLDGTTTVTYNFGRAFNTTKCVLHFGIVAKDDYIGSNNVYSNVGTPTLTYQHQPMDNDGIPTGDVLTYNVDCRDTPQVNVPIRFTTVDGGTAEIKVGESVELKDLSNEIVKDAEDRVDNYDQINGTLSYTWVLPDGTEVECGSVTVKDGTVQEADFPDRSYDYIGKKAGVYVAKLKVIFTPEKVNGANKNFSDTKTAASVKALTQTGDVEITVTSDGEEIPDGPVTLLRVTKEWGDGADKHTRDFVSFTLYKGKKGFGTATTRTIVLNAKNNWTGDFKNLPYLDENGNVISYYAEETNGVSGYYYTSSDVASHDAGAWVSDAAGLQDGKVYVFARTTSKNVTGAINESGSVSSVTAGGSVTLGDTKYSPSLSNVSDSVKWTAIANDDGTFSLKNVSTGTYLAIINEKLSASSEEYDGTDGKAKSTTHFRWENAALTATYLADKKSVTRYILIKDDLKPNLSGKVDNAMNMYRYITDPQLGNADNFGEKYYTQTIRNAKWDPINGDDPTLGFDADCSKRIDYLGDRGNNPDTSVTGDDLYRLYLDFSGQKNAVDLLIVEDSTSSMTSTYGSSTRIQTLDELVNGTIRGTKPGLSASAGTYAGASRDTDGFVYKVLRQNSKNKVAVIKLAGGNSCINGSYESNKDNVAEVVRQWTSAGDGDLTPQDCYTDVITRKSGTEYDSSFRRMDEVLQQVAGDGNTKLVLFISDGEPNIYIDASGKLTKGSNSVAGNYTKTAWSEFRKKYPSLPVYSIGIYNGDSGATDLLQTISGINNFVEASDADLLRQTFDNILAKIQATQFVLNDQLSQYVDWYGESPDLKIVRTEQDGTQTVVWKSEGAASSGNIGEAVSNTMTQGGETIDVIQSVTFTPASESDTHGTLTVTFNPKLQISADDTYTGPTM